MLAKLSHIFEKLSIISPKKKPKEIQPVKHLASGNIAKFCSFRTIFKENLDVFWGKFHQIALLFGLTNSEKRIGEKILYYTRENIGITKPNRFVTIHEGAIWVHQTIEEFAKNVHKDPNDPTKRFDERTIKKALKKLCAPETGLFIRKKLGNKNGAYSYTVNLERMIPAINELGCPSGERKLDYIESMSNTSKQATCQQYHPQRQPNVLSNLPCTPEEIRRTGTSYVDEYVNKSNKSRDLENFSNLNSEENKQNLEFANSIENSSSGFLDSQSEFSRAELIEEDPSLKEKKVLRSSENQTKKKFESQSVPPPKNSASEQHITKSKEEIARFLNPEFEKLVKGETYPWQILQRVYAFVNNQRTVFVDPQKTNAYIKFKFCKGFENWQWSNSWAQKLVDWIFEIQGNGKTFAENITFEKSTKKPVIIEREPTKPKYADRFKPKDPFSLDETRREFEQKTEITKKCSTLMNSWKVRFKSQPEIYEKLEKVLQNKGEGFMISWMHDEILLNIVKTQNEEGIAFIFKNEFYRDMVERELSRSSFERGKFDFKVAA